MIGIAGAVLVGIYTYAISSKYINMMPPIITDSDKIKLMRLERCISIAVIYSVVFLILSSIISYYKQGKFVDKILIYVSLGIFIFISLLSLLGILNAGYVY